MKRMEKSDHRRASSEELIAKRRRMILLREKGYSLHEIEMATGVSRAAVFRFLKAYKAEGPSAIQPKSRGRKYGQKRFLSPEQEAELAALLVDHSPEDWGLGKGAWTISLVQKLIGDRFDIAFTERTLRNYYRRLSLLMSSPIKQAKSNASDAVRDWLNEEYPRIKYRTRRVGASLFHITITVINGGAIHGSLIYATGYNSKKYFYICSGGISTDRLISFLTLVLENAPRGKAWFLIKDMRIAHSKRFLEWIKDRGDTAKVVYFPE